MPVVDITASDIDQGGYVGQGAANVRQLFQMAREIVSDGGGGGGGGVGGLGRRMKVKH